MVGEIITVRKIIKCNDFNTEPLRQEYQYIGSDDNLKMKQFVNDLVQINTQFLLNLQPKKNTSVWKLLEVIKKSERPLPYLSGSAFIKHIPLNNLMVNHFNIEPNRRNVRYSVADGSNSQYATFNRKKKLVGTYRRDGEHTVPKD